MPLVQCPDCDQSVSDSAPACPGCGRPTPGGTSGLVVARPGKMLFLSPLEVYVDAAHVGQIGAGKSVSLNLTPGNHRLTVEITPPRQRTKTAAIDVQVPGGGSVTAEVTFSKMTGKIGFNLS